MSYKITLCKRDLDIINDIVKENDLKGSFDIVYTPGGGIGYNVDLEYYMNINGRDATVRIPVSGVENW